jgi:hypothetical protein
MSNYAVDAETYREKLSEWMSEHGYIIILGNCDTKIGEIFIGYRGEFGLSIDQPFRVSAFTTEAEITAQHMFCLGRPLTRRRPGDVIVRLETD